jgi:methyl-accepting chemotaxis protein
MDLERWPETEEAPLMWRRNKKDDFMALLAAGAPAALLVTDASGTIVWRNKFAMELALKVSAKRGDNMLQGLRDALASTVRDSRSFPTTRMFAVRGNNGEHAAAEVICDRLEEGFVAIWSDVTDREDATRLLAEAHSDLTRATTELTGLGNGLATDTAELSHRADVVASGATQMSASIAEIGRNAAQAATNTSSAVAAAQKVTDRVSDLAESSAKIGAISQLIASIAQQTNLLALNATIEAARAGEAGRGFAVVANEVKELAGETSRATSDIAPMITDIQAASNAVRDAISEIVSLVGQIEIQQTTIASAVEEQGASSGEMSSGINGIAATTQSVAQAVDKLHQTAGYVSSKVGQLAAHP